MISVLIRTVVSYVFLVVTLKIMGKRQVGELQVTELVSALILSEIAAMPIDDPDIPLLVIIIPLGVIMSLEIINTFIITKCNFLKRVLDGRPNILIKKGELLISELERTRISLDELLSELRLSGVSDISEVEYAVLEQNGQISIIPKPLFAPLKQSDLQIEQQSKGIAHALVIDGKVNKKNLQLAGKDGGWLDGEICRRGAVLRNVFLLTVNDCGEVNIILNEGKAKK